VRSTKAVHGLDQVTDRHVGSELDRSSPRHFKEVGNGAQADLVMVAGHASLLSVANFNATNRLRQDYR
jgi:hypothetical protein